MEHADTAQGSDDPAHATEPGHAGAQPAIGDGAGAGSRDDKASRYAVDVDLTNVNTAHSLAAGAVAPGSDVLDIGAADGSMARALRKLACRVWGIEADKVAADVAAEACEDVLVADVERIDLAGAFEGRKFDVVLLLDVLEHLVNPQETLASVRDVLAPDGYVVISLPNVAHGAVRVQLLRGKFSYTDTGLLDRTHLRFFDRPGALELVEGAGFTVVDQMTVRSRLEETEIPIDRTSVQGEIAEILQSDPDSETFQFIFVLRPAGRAGNDSPPFMPLRYYQRKLRQVKLDVEALQAQMRTEHDHDMRRLRVQLEASQADADAVRRELTTVTDSLSSSLEAERERRSRAEAELSRVYETRLFRSTRLVRAIYARLRSLLASRSR